MATLNQCEFIGNVGKDPECRYTQNGDAVTNLSLACNEVWKDKAGNKQEHTEWVRCTFFGRLAEVVAEYAKKGTLIWVQGKMKTRKYEKDGVEKFSTEINCNNMQLLGGRNASDQDEDRPANKSKQSGNKDGFDDDLPF